MFSRKKKIPNEPTEELLKSVVTRADRSLASIIVALRRGNPTDSEWDRVQKQIASWRHKVLVSPFREEMMSTDDYWYKIHMKYYLDDDPSKEFNVESYLQWIWESNKWRLDETKYYASGSKIVNSSITGDFIPHPSTLDFSNFYSWGIPNLRLDLPSYQTRPAPEEPDVITESENFESTLVITFEMGGIIKFARFPRGFDSKEKQDIFTLLTEYNQNVREGFHRATRMSPRVGANEAMAMEFKKWENERQVLIQNMRVRNWRLAITPQYAEYDSRYKSEWNTDTGEWNLGEVRLHFEKAGS